MNFPLSAVPSAFTSVIATTTAKPTSQPSYASSGLSPGAKAGIAIAILILAALAGGVSFFLVRRHRARRKVVANGTTPVDALHQFKEINGGNQDRHSRAAPPYEMEGKTMERSVNQRPVATMNGTGVGSDSSNSSTVYEMDGRRPWSRGRSQPG